MRTIFFIATFLAGNIVSAFAQEKETFTLTIDVTITKHHKGTIFLALFKGKDSYLKKPYKHGIKEVKGGKTTLVFDQIEKGDYAFSLFHDLNGNKKMDKNFFGIPKEPYGFSNNKKGSMGPPDFKDAKFNIDKNKTVQVSIK